MVHTALVDSLFNTYLRLTSQSAVWFVVHVTVATRVHTYIQLFHKVHIHIMYSTALYYWEKIHTRTVHVDANSAKLPSRLYYAVFSAATILQGFL